jgi:hypothetical protein
MLNFYFAADNVDVCRVKMFISDLVRDILGG